MEACVVSSTGSREHRVRLSGLLREYQRKSAFQWVPSVVRCAAFWNPMRVRNLLPSDQACIPKANPPNCVLNKHSTSGHGLIASLSTNYYNLDGLKRCRELFVVSLKAANIRFAARLATNKFSSLGIPLSFRSSWKT